MTRNRLVVALVVTTVFVVGTACGQSVSEDDRALIEDDQAVTDEARAVTEEDQALIDAFTEDNSDLTEGGIDGRCVAIEMVSALGGAEAANDTYGITPEVVRGGIDDFAVSREDAERIADGMFECADAREWLADSFRDLPDFTQTDIDCLAAEISADAYRLVLIDVLVGGEGDTAAATQVEAEFRAAAMTCDVYLG